MRAFRLLLRAALVASVWLLGCGGKQEPADEGEDCYRDSDCKPGLVCVPAGDSARVCSSDLTGLESNVEAPPMPMPPTAGTGGTDASGGDPTAGSGATGATGATGGSG
jgi:hypothetical protein